MSWLDQAPTLGWFDEQLQKFFLIVIDNDEPMILAEDNEVSDENLWYDFYRDFTNDGIIELTK